MDDPLKRPRFLAVKIIKFVNQSRLTKTWKEKGFYQISLTDIGLLGLSIFLIKEGINTNKKPYEISFEEEE